MKRSLAPGYAPFAFISGFGGFKWGGMRTEGSPGSNASNRPRLILNGRMKDGEIISRPGMSKHSSTQVGSCVIALHDPSPGGTPVRLWCSVNGCPSVSGASVISYSPDQSPELQLYGKYVQQSDVLAALEVFDGQIYVGEGENLRMIQPYPVPYGTIGSSIGGIQDLIVRQFTGFTISCLKTFDSKLFIGLDAGAGASKIVAYDGVTFSDDLTGINAPTAMGTGREKLVVGFGSATNHIRLRSTGAAPDSTLYSTVAPGAGTVAAYNSGNSIVEWRDSVWIADGDVNVWEYDWSTLAIARTPASGTQVRSVCVAADMLAFGYNTAASARIGLYDNDTWTDVIKNLTTQFTNDSVLFSLVEFHGSLFAGMAGTTAGGGNYSGKLFASPAYDFSGTWLGTGSSSPPAATQGAVSLLVR